jgi:hypothetical protein
MIPSSTQHIAFLGIAERATQVHDGVTNIFKWNILGLKTVILFNVFPVPVNLTFVFAMRLSGTKAAHEKIRFVDNVGNEIGLFDFNLTAASIPDSITRSDNLIVSNMTDFPEGWLLLVTPIPNSFFIPAPGRYSVIWVGRDGEKDQNIGEFNCILVEPAPMTPERAAAIRSDPHALKGLRIQFGCKNCPTKLGVYAALDRGLQMSDDYTWYENLPEHFTCECGSLSLDFRIMRRNLFAMLGQPIQAGEGITRLEPIYEESTIDTIRVEFMRLLDTTPPEEKLQTFIEDNPILLRQFPADRLFFKPPILTFYKSDFAVLTPQKELILIEIETTRTRLLKKDGYHAAQLTHAVNQVQNWLAVVNEHRLAVLASLKIGPEMVGVVRGVVIAGRNRDYDPEHLRRLKGVYSGEISLLTFDDLADGLAALAREVRRL